MLSVGGDKRLIHLVVCYTVTRCDLDQQYLGEKVWQEAKLSSIDVAMTIDLNVWSEFIWFA